jgi:hypothetical protein
MQYGLAYICDVEVGQTYTVGTYYDNTWYNWKIVIKEGLDHQLEFELTSNTNCGF